MLKLVLVGQRTQQPPTLSLATNGPPQAHAFPSQPSAGGDVKILFAGDVVGKAGRQILQQGLAKLREGQEFDLVIANVENAAARVRCHTRHRRSIFCERDRRTHLGKPYLGQERSHRLPGSASPD